MDYQVVCFGEILFDILPGQSKPGGAPFNVAYHLKHAGISSYLISSVGNDAYGEELIATLQQWGIDTGGIAVNDTYATGKALVRNGPDNQPEFELLFPVAWDFIQWQHQFEAIIKNAGAFVFGSLAARNADSYNTLLRCLAATSLNVFDINIRPPHYSQAVLETLLSKTHILKLNNLELDLLAEWLGATAADEIGQINAIRNRFDIPEVVLTKGDQGASYYGTEMVLHQKALKVKVADTVGSGDAFLAGFLSRRLQSGMSIFDSMQEAVRRGAYVASKSGACPSFDEFIQL